ncbi:hypothetical protein MKEN_01413000 [Mycena kentingensis (nom. inval.)]|nr:hypothetical protein MKEN_01413000 [Mycena kentingensis (nom. inval.)]
MPALRPAPKTRFAPYLYPNLRADADREVTEAIGSSPDSNPSVSSPKSSSKSPSKSPAAKLRQERVNLRREHAVMQADVNEISHNKSTMTEILGAFDDQIRKCVEAHGIRPPTKLTGPAGACKALGHQISIGTMKQSLGQRTPSTVGDFYTPCERCGVPRLVGGTHDLFSRDNRLQRLTTARRAVVEYEPHPSSPNLDEDDDGGNGAEDLAAALNAASQANSRAISPAISETELEMPGSPEPYVVEYRDVLQSSEVGKWRGASAEAPEILPEHREAVTLLFRRDSRSVTESELGASDKENKEPEAADDVPSDLATAGDSARAQSVISISSTESASPAPARALSVSSDFSFEADIGPSVMVVILSQAPTPPFFLKVHAKRDCTLRLIEHAAQLVAANFPFHLTLSYYRPNIRSSAWLDYNLETVLRVLTRDDIVYLRNRYHTNVRVPDHFFDLRGAVLE